MKHKSTAHTRAIKAYLKPKNYTIVQGMAKVENISFSETINVIISQFANRLPQEQRLKYLLPNSGSSVIQETKHK